MYRRTTSKKFVSPLDDEIEKAVRGAGFKRKVSIDLLRDLSAIQQEEQVLPLSEVMEKVKQVVKPTRLGDKKWHTTENKRFASYSDALDDLYKSRLKREAKVHEMLSHLDTRDWEGQTPLDKAISFAKYLEARNMLDEDGDADNILSGEAEEANEHFKNKREMGGDEAGKELAQAINGKYLDFAEVSQTHIWSIAQKLNKHVELRRGIYPVYAADKMGLETRVRPMEKLSELTQAMPQFWTLPPLIRNLKIVQKEAFIRERVRRDSKKQLIGLIIDVSGSMQARLRTSKGTYAKGYKIRLALGVALNRLKAAYNGQAEVWYALFDSRLYFSNEWHAFDKKSAVQAMKDISANAFSGGSTYIQECVLRFRQRLADKDGRLPEVVLVTDGIDNVNVKRMIKELQPFTLHSFIVGDKPNSDLAQVARATRGTSVERFMGDYVGIDVDS